MLVVQGAPAAASAVDTPDHRRLLSALLAELPPGRIEDVNVMLGGGYELLPVLPDLPDEALLREARNALGDLARRLELEEAETWVVNAPSTKEGILDMARK